MEVGVSNFRNPNEVQVKGICILILTYINCMDNNLVFKQKILYTTLETICIALVYAFNIWKWESQSSSDLIDKLFKYN